MSKPKHYRRGVNKNGARMAHTVPARKGEWPYWMDLNNEIEELKNKGPFAHLVKLRRYLKRAKPATA